MGFPPSPYWRYLYPLRFFVPFKITGAPGFLFAGVQILQHFFGMFAAYGRCTASEDLDPDRLFSAYITGFFHRSALIFAGEIHPPSIACDS